MEVEIDGVIYVDAAEASRLLGVKPATLYAYASRGRIRSYRQGARRARLYRRDELEALTRIAPTAGEITRRGSGEHLPRVDEWMPYTG